MLHIAYLHVYIVIVNTTTASVDVSCFAKTDKLLDQLFPIRLPKGSTKELSMYNCDQIYKYKSPRGKVCYCSFELLPGLGDASYFSFLRCLFFSFIGSNTNSTHAMMRPSLLCMNIYMYKLLCHGVGSLT